MASVFTHSFTGLALGKILFAGPMPTRFWVLAAVCGSLPDIDAIGHVLGVPYASLWGHRGMTHSIAFALVAGITTATLAFRETPVLSAQWWALAGFFFIATISHSVLDAMTTGGLGVAFFSPFDTTRYFFPFHPIQVSPIGVKAFFSEWGLRVIKSEFLLVWLPLIVIAGVMMAVRRK